MIETIRWRPVTKGRIGVDAPPPQTKVLIRLDTGEIRETRTRLADGWLGCNVRYWCYSSDRRCQRTADEMFEGIKDHDFTPEGYGSSGQQ